MNKRSYAGKYNPFFGKKHTEESKRKISLSKSGSCSGSNNPMYGKQHSKETKIKIGAIHKGKIISKETREKMSVSLKGRKVSKETREKLRKSRLLWIKNNEEEFIKMIQKAGKVRATRKPNLLEIDFFRFLESNFKGEWEYTGDYSFMIGRYNPDFKHKYKNLLIVLYGACHNNESISKRENRIKKFKDFGYNTLEVRASELRNKNLLIELYGACHNNESISKRENRIKKFKDFGYNTLEVRASELRNKNLLIDKLKEFCY